MTSNGHYILGVCVTSLNQKRYADFLQCLQKEAPRFRCKLLIFTCSRDLSQKTEHDQGEKSIFQLIPFSIIDGLILLTESIKDKAIPTALAARAKESGIPLFSVDEELEGCWNIYYGYAEAFSGLLRHIIGHHGCRRINLIAGVKDSPFEQERTAIYRAILAENGIPVEEERIYYGNYWHGPTNEAIDRIMRSDLPFPDAIVCENDAMAIAVCDRLACYGYTVPDDVLVTGLDGIEEAQSHTPSITTASQDQMGMVLKIYTLFQEIRQGRKPEKHTVVPFQLRLEQSCGCIPPMSRESNSIVLKMQQTVADAQQFDMHMEAMRHRLIRLSYRDLLPQLEHYMCYMSWICLRSDYSTMERDFPFGSYEENLPAFTPQMNAVLSRQAGGCQYNTFFSLDELLPDMDTLLRENSGFFFLPLHFEKATFGYFAIALERDYLTYNKLSKFCESLCTIFEVIQEQERVRILNRQLDATNWKLTNLYNLDPLTGLLNRRGFQAEIEKAQTALSAQSCQLVLFSIDMDELKKINDTYGHKEGDYSLCMISDCMKHVNRKFESMVCARFGGDEFLMAGFFDPLLPVSEEILSAFQEQLAFLNSVSDKEYKVDASIGYLSLIPEPGFDMESLINQVDSLMYENKKKKKRLAGKPEER